MTEMLIGPGPSNYGDRCLHCYVTGLRSGAKHSAGCPRVVERCKRNQHDACERDRCKCNCHAPLTRTEIHRLRKMLAKR